MDISIKVMTQILYTYVCRYILLTDYTASWQEKQKNSEGEQKEELISIN